MSSAPPTLPIPCSNCGGEPFSRTPGPVALVRYDPPDGVDMTKVVAVDAFICDSCGLISLFRFQR